MSGARRLDTGTVARLGLAALMVLVLALILLGRRDDSGDGGDPGAAPGATAPSEAFLPSLAPGASPSEEGFCASYRMLAAAQGQYAAQPDATGADLLRRSADTLLATGVPESMGRSARAGYLVEITGIYGSLGLELDPRAVPGAGDGTKVTGAAAEFSGWLVQFCPAFG